jgi:hypothetical protein
VAVQLTAEARPLLLRVQHDLSAAQRGARPKAPWAGGVKRTEFLAVLRALSFVMLGPLWEDALRFPPTHCPNEPSWSLADHWTPGSLPPEMAAPVLLASATFLAAESRTRLQGVTWNPRLLLAGENARIDAETLLWHLRATDAEWVQHLFGAPVVRPFTVLLTALRGDRFSRGARREAARRCQGVGGAAGRMRDGQTATRREAPAGDTVQERAYPSSARFAIGQFIEGDACPAPPRLSRTQIAATFAVYAAIGSDRTTTACCPVANGLC